MKLNLLEGVRCYLATRRRLGFALAKEGVQLQGLVRYAKHIGHRGALTAQLAVQWAQQPQQTDRLYWASRLDIARRFASFWIAYDPRTEIPPRGLFGPSFRRRPVHVYTPQEISRLLAAATDQSPKRPFRGQTFRTLIGLLACTGMRIGEVLGLADQDLDWTTGVLTIRHAKYGHARLVPLSSSTLKALRDYQQFDDRRPAAAFAATWSGPKHLCPACTIYATPSPYEPSCNGMSRASRLTPNFGSSRLIWDTDIPPTRIGI
jgi:integrase